MKVNGRFFGANKIQNEVSCLLLLQRYCPSIPSPRPLAWSEDGHVATFTILHKSESCLLEAPLGVEEIEHGGWILMSHIPGIPVPVSDLNDETLASLGGQLGDLVAHMRQDIPAQERCGNVCLSFQGSPDSNLEDTSITIRHIIHEGLSTSEAITSSNQYYY